MMNRHSLHMSGSRIRNAIAAFVPPTWGQAVIPKSVTDIIKRSKNVASWLCCQIPCLNQHNAGRFAEPTSLKVVAGARTRLDLYRNDAGRGFLPEGQQVDAAVVCRVCDVDALTHEFRCHEHFPGFPNKCGFTHSKFPMWPSLCVACATGSTWLRLFDARRLVGSETMFAAYHRQGVRAFMSS